MAQSPLPDPVWTSAAELCINCGYSLRGLVRAQPSETTNSAASPSRCPECGTGFADRQLVLFGIPYRSRSISPARRLAWAAVIAGLFIVTTLWPLLLVVHWLLLVLLIAAAGGGMLALQLTSQRERRGVERFVFTPAGVARLPLVIEPGGASRLDTIFIPWDPAVSIRWKRVGPFWRRLYLRGAASSGESKRLLLDAGVRCPDAAAAKVDQAIRDLINGRTPSTSEANPHRTHPPVQRPEVPQVQ